MNPVLAVVVPVCVALPALPHNHPLVPHLHPTQRLHSLGALSSSLSSFLSTSNKRKCKTARQLLLSVTLSHGFLPCLESNPNTFHAPSPQSGTRSALQSPLITGTESLPATGPLHWPGTLFSHIFPWLAPPLCVLQVLCVIGAPLNSYDISQRRLT